ncbi:MAG: hypothetical protein FWG85_05990, partial [Bacteroidetes bacterium]|nr:hypothetical protein [Bacteroidota bacterium]
MFKSKHYQGNGTLANAKNTDTSSYTCICSKITTSNVVETTTRGGVTTTSRVVELLQTTRIAELVSASTNLTRDRKST